jgi:hypothetical protein
MEVPAGDQVSMLVLTMMSTSTASPLRTRTGLASGDVPVGGPQDIVTRWPVSAWNCVAMRLNAPLRMPVVRTLSSTSLSMLTRAPG